MKTINYHIECVLVPKKRHIMLLGHYTTSPLEEQNLIMKDKASKMVRPIMTLLESAKTQNAIQQSRMHVYLRKVKRIVTSTPLWLLSATARKDDTYCESQLQ